MVVGLNTDGYWFTIGSGDFFNSFFSTVVVNLESGRWGSRFPMIMNGLYRGKVEANDVEPTLVELAQIREEFRALPPTSVVWDFEDRSKQPPWGDDVADNITDLSNYFVTSNGEDLFEVIEEGLQKAKQYGWPIEVESL
ncbi:immunity 70 family protein [Trueperella bialowiezensis]|uniref:Immunity protein 70 n=1 Tax=Trueperella bialowiezensis TaxID=312285 RepID=A0A3S4UZB2_9ACTO|nr:immunity 70 family protein [Trueperella bialowiezensis]VEI13478.1 Uncharacterised protein [Trueperella bialowiezensis]